MGTSAYLVNVDTQEYYELGKYAGWCSVDWSRASQEELARRIASYWQELEDDDSDLELRSRQDAKSENMATKLWPILERWGWNFHAVPDDTFYELFASAVKVGSRYDDFALDSLPPGGDDA